MADSFAQLVVQLELQQAAFAQGMNDAARKLDAIGTSAAKSQQNLEKMSKELSGVAAGARDAAAAFLSFQSFKMIAEAADQLNALKASLGAIIGEGNRAADMMQRIFDIADRTGAPLEAVASATENLATVLGHVGASNDQIAAITENFIKLGAIAGQSSQQSAAAINQLAQTLAKSKVSADDLNNALKIVPADFGVPIAKLRELAQQGKLTGSDIGNALLAATSQIDEKFNQLPATLEQSMNRA